MHIACDVMQVNARDSIFFAALNAYGHKGVHTTKYCLCYICYCLDELTMLYVRRYNVYERIKTVLKKMTDPKLDLQKKFFPSRKRVLNSTLCVLNKPEPAKKKKKKIAQKQKKLDALLDSQVSVGSFFNSQGCAPASPTQNLSLVGCTPTSPPASPQSLVGCTPTSPPASPQTPTQNLSLVGCAPTSPPASPRSPRTPVGK